MSSSCRGRFSEIVPSPMQSCRSSRFEIELFLVIICYYFFSKMFSEKKPATGFFSPVFFRKELRPRAALLRAVDRHPVGTTHPARWPSGGAPARSPPFMFCKKSSVQFFWPTFSQICGSLLFCEI